MTNEGEIYVKSRTESRRMWATLQNVDLNDIDHCNNEPKTTQSIHWIRSSIKTVIHTRYDSKNRHERVSGNVLWGACLHGATRAATPRRASNTLCLMWLEALRAGRGTRGPGNGDWRLWSSPPVYDRSISWHSSTALRIMVATSSAFWTTRM